MGIFDFCSLTKANGGVRILGCIPACVPLSYAARVNWVRGHRLRWRLLALSDDDSVRTHVALLRGVNVMGRNKMSMVELREVVASLGYGNVTTYIQSGNVVFAAADADADSGGLADKIEVAIAGRLAVRPAVVVIGRAELTQCVRDNPFPSEDYL